MLAPVLTVLLLSAAAGPGAPNPAGPTPAEAVALTAPKLTLEDVEAAAEDGGGLVLRPWKQRPGTWLTLVAEIGEPDNSGAQDATVHVALLAHHDQRWAVVARLDEKRPSPGRGKISYAFDLAPYRLNENEVAFGVRERFEYALDGESETGENLILYRVVGARLVRVLDLAMGGEASGLERSVRNHIVVAVSSRKTRGFFELIVSEVLKLSWKRKPSKTVSVYVWLGEGYEEGLRSVLLQMSSLNGIRAGTGQYLKLVGRRTGAPLVRTVESWNISAKRFDKDVKSLLPHEPTGGEELTCDDLARTCTFSWESSQTTEYRFTPRPTAPKLAEIHYDAEGE